MDERVESKNWVYLKDHGIWVSCIVFVLNCTCHIVFIMGTTSHEMCKLVKAEKARQIMTELDLRAYTNRLKVVK
jgi:hypothetical protein